MASVDELKQLVSRLESRIEQLESKITGTGRASGSEDGMRMIIMGPPGAGTRFRSTHFGAYDMMLMMGRKGDTGSTYQGQVLRVPSRKL